jgi:pyridoxamine 5'-phosphate oxidase
MDQSIADIRNEYSKAILSENDVAVNAMDQFTRWWNEAMECKIYEVNAMTLATCAPQAFPTSRIVLLKGYSSEGFIFFTNYDSEKGKAIALNPKVSLLFFWKELERQVRINGIAEKISEQASDEYFNSRPLGSKIGAWASPQSLPISSREILEERYLNFTTQFANKEVSRPPHWGGYLVKPQSVEFWQGRSSRLHDRMLYTKKTGTNSWKVERLAP